MLRDGLDVVLEGLVLTDAIQEAIQKYLRRVQDISPCDSFIKLKIIKDAFCYTGQLQIHATRFRLDFDLQHDSVCELLQRVLNEVERQVSLWHLSESAGGENDQFTAA